MIKIGYVDPFLNSPAFHCFNGFVANFGLQTFYHMPATYGLGSLYALAPETSAYFVAGSVSNVTEPLPWHEPLAMFLLEELRRGKPVLGACFGHQLLCHAFGSVVDYNFPGQEKLLGLRHMKITESFFNFSEGEVFALPVSHRQVVKTLGPDLLAVGEGLENDIVIHRSLPLLTTQAHPEASKHFCEYDIQEISEEEDLKGRRDGKLFIERFLLHFKLLDQR